MVTITRLYYKHTVDCIACVWLRIEAVSDGKLKLSLRNLDNKTLKNIWKIRRTDQNALHQL